MPPEDLLAHVHAVQPVGQAAALLDVKLHIFLDRRRGGDGEHGLAHAGDGQHGALAGHVLEALAAAQGLHAEGFHIRRILADGRDDAEHRD